MPDSLTAARSFLIDRMREKDLPRVLEIERACFPDPWSRDSFLYEIRDNVCASNFVLREPGASGRIAAYACVWYIEEEAHINNLAVHPEARRRGLGRRLMRAVLREAIRRGCRTALLQVRPSNEAAITLYRSVGFVPGGRRRSYYSNTGEDAIVMSRTLLARRKAPRRAG
ncbi:MAG: ribosomal protein S18-alanine N-acetyltransferase [Vicinamibacteria bacterium]